MLKRKKPVLRKLGDDKWGERTSITGLFWSWTRRRFRPVALAQPVTQRSTSKEHLKMNQRLLLLELHPPKAMAAVDTRSRTKKSLHMSTLVRHRMITTIPPRTLLQYRLQ